MAAKAVKRGMMKSVTHRRVPEQSGQGLLIDPANNVNGKWIRKKRAADPKRNNEPLVGRLRNSPRPMINKSGYTTHDGTKPSVKIKISPPNRLAATATTRI